jgi:hypothetical protein
MDLLRAGGVDAVNDLHRSVAQLGYSVARSRLHRAAIAAAAVAPGKPISTISPHLRHSRCTSLSSCSSSSSNSSSGNNPSSNALLDMQLLASAMQPRLRAALRRQPPPAPLHLRADYRGSVDEKPACAISPLLYAGDSNDLAAPMALDGEKCRVRCYVEGSDSRLASWSPLAPYYEVSIARTTSVDVVLETLAPIVTASWQYTLRDPIDDWRRPLAATDQRCSASAAGSRHLSLCVRTRPGGKLLSLFRGERLYAALLGWFPLAVPGWPRLFIVHRSSLG